MRYGGWDRVAAFGCGKQLTEIPWDYVPPFPSPYATLCTYEPAVGSWAHCVDQVLQENATDPAQQLHTAIKFVNVACEKAGGGLVQFTVDKWIASLNNATDYLQQVPTDGGPVVFPVNLNEHSRRNFTRGVRAEFLNLDESNDAGNWMYYYFFTVLLVYLLFSWIKPLFRKDMPFLKKANTYMVNLKSRFNIGTSCFSNKHSQHSIWALGGLIPTSEESTVLFGYIFVHSLALVCNYSIDPFEILESVIEQKLQALGNRSGILAFAQLPLLVVLTTRSSLLMHFTGMKYSTFILLHRWVGRVIIFDSIIHSIAFYFHEKMGGMLGIISHAHWWIAGVVATSLCCAIFVFGTGAFRRRFYETFLYTHIAFALLFFYECWHHVENFGWLNWLKVSLAFWALERFYRLLLILKNGIVNAKLDIECSTPFDSLELCESEPLLTLKVDKPKNWHFKASQYAFVYFMLPSIFWQSHPFTVTTDVDGTLKLVIAVKSGATKILYKNLLSQVKDNTSNVRVRLLLEGPYGVPPAINKYDRLLLICGGSGVPGPLGLTLSSLQYVDATAVKLVVVVRDWGIMDAYRSQITEIINSGVRLMFYYTGSKENTEWSQILEVHYGRPNIKGILNDVLSSQSSSSKSPNLGIICCGPPGLNDMTRNIVANIMLDHPETSIEFNEEYQVW